MIHVAIDLQNISFHDESRRYVQAQAGSLVSTYKIGRFVFTGTAGTRVVRIAPNVGIANEHRGFMWSGGVRYDAASWAHLSLTTGQDILISPLVTGQGNVEHYFRIDCEFGLI